MHAHKKSITKFMKWGIGIFVVAIVTGVALWLFLPRTSQEAPIPFAKKNEINVPIATSEEKPSMSLTSDYIFEEQYRTDSKVFSCRMRRGTESGCDLFVSDLMGNNSRDIGIKIDAGYLDRKILPSPNGTNLLLVHENSAILLHTSSLEQRMIFKTEDGTALGTYTGFPTFVPYVKWTDNNEIQVSIFKQYTSEPYAGEPVAIPLEVKTIQI